MSGIEVIIMILIAYIIGAVYGFSKGVEHRHKHDDDDDGPNYYRPGPV